MLRHGAISGRRAAQHDNPCQDHRDAGKLTAGLPGGARAAWASPLQMVTIWFGNTQEIIPSRSPWLR
jgi:hypothetical protein